MFKAYEALNPDTGSACIRVYRGGNLIYQRGDTDEEYYLGQPAQEEYKVPAVPNGVDVTGRGHPDMIVRSWSGGAHCCFKQYVFELDPEFKLLATIDEGDADGHFERIDQAYYYVTQDIFSYWPGSFASSAQHKVVLRFVADANGGAFHVAMDRMRYPAPSPQQWKAALKDVDDVFVDHPEGDRDDLSTTLWDTVLDLIYTGHSDLAWKFVSEANPKALQGDNPDLAEFCSVLKSDPYWPDIAPTLKNTPPTCAQAKPARR